MIHIGLYQFPKIETADENLAECEPENFGFCIENFASRQVEKLFIGRPLKTHSDGPQLFASSLRRKKEKHYLLVMSLIFKTLVETAIFRPEHWLLQWRMNKLRFVLPF